MRRAAKTDGNHAEIAQAFRDCGCSVQDLSRVGQGCPDLLVGIYNRNLLVEVKDGRLSESRRRLTKDQEKWHGAWRGQKAVVSNVEQALALIDYVRMNG